MYKKENAPDLWRGPREHSIHFYPMYKILSFGRSCKAYRRLYQEFGPDLTLLCESCGRKLHKHGRYYRWVASKRELIQIPIYRWLCPGCGTTVSLLPDFLVPWARFTTWVRESAMVRKRQSQSFRKIAATVTSDEMGLSADTVKRWWRRWLKRAGSVSLWLARELVRSGMDDDWLHLYPNPVKASPVDTLKWFDQLLSQYTPKTSWLRGIWPFLNLRVPGTCIL